MEIRWYRLRQSRSSPPELAATDATRRLTYTSALGQFEELIKAAESVSPAARPLPLYYALSQAGKAISAALDPNDVNPGHGLSATVHDALLDTQVSPNGREQEFQSVAAATGSATLVAPTQLGALWASLVELLQTDAPGERWPRALEMRSEADLGYGRRMTDTWVDAALVLPRPMEDAELADFLAVYPAAEGAEIVGAADVGGLTNYVPEGAPSVCYLRWALDGPSCDHAQAHLDRVAPLASTHAMIRYARPRLPDGPMPSPLMTWWALLYGFSILARYHPAEWQSALQIDSSDLAVPIEDVLDEAVQHVPDLVWQALLGHLHDPWA